ncbi:OmpA family protein [Algiphilus sp. NNCM1]|nr:OmpA family protein [Algiphilus acroporae]
MSTKKWALGLAVSGALIAGNAVAQEEESTTSSYFSFLGSYSMMDEDRTPLEKGEEGYGFQAMYGTQYGSGFGWAIGLGSQIIETDIDSFTDFYRHNVELQGTYALGDRTGFTPYALIGIGGNYNDVRDVEEGDSFDPYGTAGLGVVTGPLTERGELKLRAEVRYVYDTYSEEYQDYTALVGIELPLFKRVVNMPPPPAPEKEVQVVEAELEDSDGDGIPDQADKCPGTPAGTRVDGEGCALSDLINLFGVLFAFDSADLNANARRLLNPVVGLFNRYPDLEVEVAGHTDSVGPDDYNQQLSQARAESVRQYLIDHGVPPSQVTAQGYGESEPVATNDTEEGRQDNRRVEIRILN